MKTIPLNADCLEYLKERFLYIFEEDLIAEICKYSQLKRIEADFMLMDIGQTITHMPLIVSGSIKILTEDKDENELLLYYLEVGDTCAMTLNCCSRSAKSNIRAVTEAPSEVLFIPVEKMEEWMVKFSSWRNFVLESYNTRLQEMLTAIDSLAFDDLEKRLYKYLQDKVIINKNPVLNITQSDVARDLNSSRVVISRLLKKLHLDKKINYSRNQIEVFNFFGKG
jgi:CRP/FNR family transcriptional regulator